jgi:hypothetical protein
MNLLYEYLPQTTLSNLIPNMPMRNNKVQFPVNIKIIFSRCDICERGYEAPENETNNPTSAIPEEELEQWEPLLLLCDSCRQELEVYPFNR